MQHAPSTYVMVRAFLLLCKLNSYKLSDKALFDAFMFKNNLSHMACPCCGSKGRHTLYSSYERSMISLEEGERRDLVVTIPRIIDNVMTTALKAGYQMQKSVIDSDVILAAINEQALG